MITIEEAKKAMDEMMAQGTTEEEMLGILYLMFQDDKISLDELEALIGALGYEFSDEFRNMTPEQQKTDGYEFEDEPEEGVTDEQIEDAKETDTDADADADESGKGKDEDQDQDKGEDQDNQKNDQKDEEAEEKDEVMRKLYGFKN